MEANNMKAMRELVRRIVKSLGGKAEVAPANMTPHEVAILNQCRAALAAPPRNCDMFANLHDAWLAWQSYCADNIGTKTMKFHVWLYSTAEKGETDGSK